MIISAAPSAIIRIITIKLKITMMIINKKSMVAREEVNNKINKEK